MHYKYTDIKAIVAEILENKKDKGGIKNIYFVGCGGSLGALYPAKTFMERESLTAVVLLCDPRLGLTELDEALLDALRPRVEQGLKFLVLLTNVHEGYAAQLAERTGDLGERRGDARPVVMDEKTHDERHQHRENHWFGHGPGVHVNTGNEQGQNDRHVNDGGG